ncbi:putative phosphoglycerate mutase [Kibdelosporangium banguiense]|uniref:Phosphoglycerate mutase n=1 Tax=Kibdelosporangium banguiense TaxID=1365924 RepID=A0ABS4U112_9PSEU|nr:histidine phosphatase family protein [Kibdelosporangium banguiense]MBP2330331.1 putative phosphoglycerate mutase [Kibdelosporangium banguiense]
MIERVLLARHGQTEWNLQGRRQGQLDSPLTEQGFEQARRNAELLDAVDIVFTSPLGRAVSTAKIFAEHLGATVMVIDELAELHHGRLAGLTNNEIKQQHNNEWHRRTQDKYRWRFPDGESYADVDERAATALTLIEGHAADRPLIVSHEMIGRMLLRRLLDLDPADALRRHHPHNVIYEVIPGFAHLQELQSPNPLHDDPTPAP